MMGGRNDDFIRNGEFHCEICGGDDYVPSKIAVSASFGSVHDGEQLTLDVCGQCADAVFDLIMSRAEGLQSREHNQMKVIQFPHGKNTDERTEMQW